MLSLAHCTKCLKTLAKVMPDCSYRAGRKILILCMYFMISIESVKIPAFGNSTLDERCQNASFLSNENLDRKTFLDSTHLIRAN